MHSLFYAVLSPENTCIYVKMLFQLKLMLALQPIISIKGVQKQICLPIGTVEAVENLLAEFFTK